MNDKIKQIGINKIKKAKKMTQKDKTRLLNIGLSIGEVEKLEQELLKQEHIKKATFEDLENLELSEQELKQEQINKLIKKYNVTDVEVLKILNSNSNVSSTDNTKKELMKLGICYLKANDLLDCDLLNCEYIEKVFKAYKIKNVMIARYLNLNDNAPFSYKRNEISYKKLQLFKLGYLFLIKNSLI